MRTVRPIHILGSNITLYCDLFDELSDNVFWSKTPINSSESINFINTNNIPIRYKIKTTQHSLNLSVSTLTIYGLTGDDEATFICTGSTSSRQNITLARIYIYINILFKITWTLKHISTTFKK